MPRKPEIGSHLNVPHTKAHLVFGLEGLELGPFGLGLDLIGLPSRFSTGPTSLFLYLRLLVGSHVDMRFSALGGKMSIVHSRDYRRLVRILPKIWREGLQRETGVVARWY